MCYLCLRTNLLPISPTVRTSHLSLTIIINPISGGASGSAGLVRAEMARRACARSGVEAEIVLTQRRGHARDLAGEAAARGASAIIAWGGDGTVNEVASALAFGAVPLGIVPAGSGNGLARELGISSRPDRALAAALSSRPRAIDVGEVDNRLFVNVAGFGIEAYVASLFNASANRRRGFAGYAGITARALVTYVPVRYRIAVGEEVVDVRAVLVTLANSAQYGNGVRIAPGAQLDDGLLNLVVVQERSRLGTVLNLPRLFTGTVAGMSGCRMLPVREMTIEAEKPMIYHVDGEPIEGGTCLKARVHPGALYVLA